MSAYEDIINKITSKKYACINLGLENITKALQLLDNPQDKISCIQIAGTNGKGSVATIMSSILKEAGYKVGLFISPHVFEYTERISISGLDINEDDFVAYAKKVFEVVEINNVQLTEFEILTVMMFLYFKDNDVDVAILETGLGGRLDATNVVTSNLCSIITHIDYDHTDKLGITKEQIAYEKAGIIKSGCPVITSEGYEIIKTRADELQSLFILVAPCNDATFLKALTLKGIHQSDNLALALAAIELLYKNIDTQTIICGLKNVKHICRFQYVKNKNLLIDAAHNPDGIRALNKNLGLYFPNIKKRFIFGCLDTKNYSAMLDELFDFSIYGDEQPEIYFYKFNSEHSCSYKILMESCIYFSKELKSIKDITFYDNTLTVICGSIYMINELVSKDWL